MMMNNYRKILKPQWRGTATKKVKNNTAVEKDAVGADSCFPSDKSENVQDSASLDWRLILQNMFAEHKINLIVQIFLAVHSHLLTLTMFEHGQSCTTTAAAKAASSFFLHQDVPTNKNQIKSHKFNWKKSKIIWHASLNSVVHDVDWLEEIKTLDCLFQISTQS